MVDLSHLNSNKKKIDLSHLNSNAAPQEEEQEYGRSPFERGPVQMAMHVPEVIVKDIGSFIGEQGLPALGQLFTNPMRAAKNVIAGPLIGLSNLPNIPSATAPYLHHLGLIDKKALEEAQKAGAIIPHGEYSAPVKKLFGLEEEEPGDVLLQMAAPFGPHIGKGAKAVYKSLSPGNKLEMGHLEALRSQLANKNLSLKEVADIHAKQMEAEEAAKAASTREVGASEPNAMFNQLGKKENALEQAKQNLSMTQAEAEQQAALPELPEIDSAESVQNVTNAENAMMQSHQHGANLEAAQEQNQQALESHEAKVGEFLHEGKAHHVRVGEFFKQHLENTHKELKKDYQEAADAISDAKVKMPKPKEEKLGTMTFDANGKPITTAIDVDAVIDEIRKDGLIVKNGKPMISSKHIKTVSENPVLDQLLVEAPTSRITDAGKFMTKFKDFKKAIYDAKQQMKTTDSAQERSHIAEAIPKAQRVLAVAEKALEEGIGKENAATFKELNQRYSDFYDLSDNPTMRYAAKHGKMPGNMIEKLAGSGIGQDQMRAIAKSNPEIVKHIIGQTYEGKIGKAKIHNPGELIREWTAEVPELQNMTQQRTNLQGRIATTKQNIERHKERHGEIVAAHKEAIARAKETEKEATAQQEEKAKREQTALKFNKQIEDLRSDIKSQEEAIGKYREKQQLLEKESQKSKITLEQKMKVQAELKEIKEKITERKKNVEKSKGFLFKKIRTGYRITKGIVRGLSKLGGL